MTQKDLAQKRKWNVQYRAVCKRVLFIKTCGFAPCTGSYDKLEDQAVQEQRWSNFLCSDGNAEYQSKPI